MQKNLSRMFLFLLGLLFFVSICRADEGKIEREESEIRCLAGVEFLAGFNKAKLHAKGDYTLSPFIVDFDFDLKPLTKKIGINPWGLFQFQIEPYIAPVYEPDSNVEVGTGFILKLGILPEDSKFQPYIKAGPGMLYMTQHTREQGTQFNFFQYGGVGMHYFFAKNTALTVEYRYRHASNAGIEDPNHGINSQFALAGIAYRF